jgi:hypothetical protein
MLRFPKHDAAAPNAVGDDACAATNCWYRSAMTIQTDLSALHARLQGDGFAFLGADTMDGLLGDPRALEDWQAFTDSWNDLALDTYLAAKGRQRRRRHATFSITPDGRILRNEPQPHVQTLQHNALQGGIERWFAPIRPAIADGPSFRRMLQFSYTLFGSLAPRVPRWHVEAHQFRIEARIGEAGEPTPEGVHRDGVDYVLVLLIDRANIESGITTIHGSRGELLGSFTLTRVLDAALVDDAKVSHGVTAVTPFDPTQPAHRDVLVVTFKATTPA